MTISRFQSPLAAFSRSPFMYKPEKFVSSPMLALFFPHSPIAESVKQIRRKKEDDLEFEF